MPECLLLPFLGCSTTWTCSWLVVISTTSTCLSRYLNISEFSIFACLHLHVPGTKVISPGWLCYYWAAPWTFSGAKSIRSTLFVFHYLIFAVWCALIELGWVNSVSCDVYVWACVCVSVCLLSVLREWETRSLQDGLYTILALRSILLRASIV